MDWSIILNLLFGTGLVATIVGLLSIRSELRKVRAEAEKAQAEADTVKITNTEQATRILVENIVKPLTEKLDETHRELQDNKRELMRLRKAVEAIQICPYRNECPVLGELQNSEDGAGGDEAPSINGHTVGHQPGDDKSGDRTRRGKSSIDPTGKRRRKPARRGGIQSHGGADQGVRPEEEG